MRNIKHEAEAIQVSIYCDVIMQILKKHKELSISKILVFSYLIKKDNLEIRSVYTANTSQDIVYKSLSLLAGDYVGFCNSIEYIIKAIHLLIQNNLINLEGNIIYEVLKIEYGKTVYVESSFLEKAIEASKKLTDKQFMKEVTSNV